jgi:hypothetical protein
MFEEQVNVVEAASPSTPSLANLWSTEKVCACEDAVRSRQRNVMMDLMGNSI